MTQHTTLKDAMLPAISVILPNYNGRHLLEKNLPSLAAALEGIPHEIIVVDDCSRDDSVNFLVSAYPDIRIVRNEHNQGFSATCNRGVEAATSPLLCIVNTDVTFTADYFHKAIPHFDSPGLFAVKGDIVNYREVMDKPYNIQKTSILCFKRGFLRTHPRIEPDPSRLNGQVGGQYVLLGCCFVCRRDMMLELGGFDEIFSPFYWEDSDLPLRALRRGWRLAYEPRCIVYHHASSTIGKYRSNARRRIISVRNKFIFTWRFLHGFRAWTAHIFFTTGSLLVRWIVLDWKYYVSFARAIIRYNTYQTKN